MHNRGHHPLHGITTNTVMLKGFNNFPVISKFVCQLCQDISHNISLNIGQTETPPLKFKGEPFVINTHDMH